MTMKICSEDGCGRKLVAHGLCSKHYARGRANGTFPIGTFTKDRVARFWEKVDKNGPVPTHVPELGACWVWTADAFVKGYGSVRWDGKRRTAHRVSWEIDSGVAPGKANVLHRCDNPPCVRPSHLFLGTNADNVADKIAKGRQIHGEQLTAAKLTEEQVLEMRALRSAGKSVEDLGALFGVAPAHASRICLGRTWKHLGAAVPKRRQGKLTEQQVADMRARRAVGEPRPVLAAEFGVSSAHVSRVCLGRYW